MWIVRYFEACPMVGEYLAKKKFDDEAQAKAFAKKVDGSIEARPVFC